MFEGSLPKGDLIYEVPEEDYIRWRKKDLFSLYFHLTILLLLLFTGGYLMIEMYSSFGFSFPLCFITGIVLAGGALIFSDIPRGSARARLFRLRIYENGFEPSIRFNANYESEKPVFIRFEDIIEVELPRHGYDFTLKLKDRSRMYVESRWDVKGYLILYKMFRKRYPDPSQPDIETLSRYLTAHEMLVKKEMTKKEFLPYLEDYIKDEQRRSNQEDSSGD